MHDLRKMIVCDSRQTTNCWSRKHTLFSSSLLSLSCTTLKYALCALSSLSSLTCHFFSFFILPSFPSLLYLFFIFPLPIFPSSFLSSLPFPFSPFFRPADFLSSSPLLGPISHALHIRQMPITYGRSTRHFVL